ncbi:CHC2 zinc finger domain-containing protein [Rhodospirillaceae bacterium SYSU D60014]|uniref:CHC2 zinc finger domain-containing protein n=1 Tax=Virgifigura deserti TaxID=2268457 RepID=UPI000E672C58
MNAPRFTEAFLDDVRARTSLVELIGGHVRLMRRGRDHVGACPFHDERTPSFTVSEEKGFFHCFGCGAHGDAIAFLQRLGGLRFPGALEALASRAGLLPGRDDAAGAPRPAIERPSPRDLEDRRRDLIAWSRRIWREATALPGTLGEVYLRHRGIASPELLAVPTLRYAAALEHRETGLMLPTLVGAVQGADGSITGIHRTFLTSDGRGKAGVSSPKKMGGICWGGAVRFAKAGERLAIGEGIETTLSVVQSVPGLPGWAALSLGNIAGAGFGPGKPHPRLPGRVLPAEEPDMGRPGIRFPDVVREVVICADADSRDPESAEALLIRAGRRFMAEGRIVRMARPPLGSDFNDILRGVPSDEH